MYCKNCGKELMSGVNFCAECGAAVEEQRVETERNQTIFKFDKKLLVLLLAGVVFIAIVVGAFALFSGSEGFSKPEEAAENYVLGYFSGDAEMLLESVPDFLVRNAARSYGVSEENVDKLIEVMESRLDPSDIHDCVIWKSSISANDDDLSDYIESLHEGDYETTYEELSKIEDYQMVEVYCLVDGEEEEYIVFCVKYNGRWYALDID